MNVQNLDTYDIIGVLGGYPSRARAAKILFERQIAPKILVSGSEQNIHESTDILSSGGIDNSHILKAHATASTCDEARINYLMMEKYKLSKGLIVTNEFHSRRTRDVYKYFSAHYPNITIDIYACPNPPQIDANILYHRFRELIKSIYYWIHYGIKPSML